MTTTGHLSDTAPTSKSDPLLTFMFSVEGKVTTKKPDPETGYDSKDLSGYFTEFSGLETEFEVITFKYCNDKGQPSKWLLPGRSSRNPVTLKRGITDDLTFWQWWQTVQAGKIKAARSNITITMYSRANDPLIKWDLFDAWPSKIVAPDFDAGSSDFGVEEITIVYASVQFTQLPALENA